MDMTIEADSTQINALDLVEPVTVTITGSSKGPDAKRPVNLEVAEFPGRSYRPGLSMRRLLVSVWGRDSKTYVGRRITLYNETSVKFGNKSTGGVRIKALSHIEKGFTSTQMESQGKYVTYAIEKLPDLPPAITPETVDEIQERIDNATTLDDLSNIAADLKTWNLGQHREQLQAAWSRRKGEIENGGEPG